MEYPTIEYNNGHKSTYLSDSTTTISQAVSDARQLMPKGSTKFRFVLRSAKSVWMS